MSLISALREAKRYDPDCVAFCDQVRKDIMYMEQEELSLKDWIIPSSFPKELVLEKVKKDNSSCLKFSLETVMDEPFVKYVLRVYDPRPRDNWKYGNDKRSYKK